MKILLATDDSKFSEAAAKSLAQQYRPQDTEVRVLPVVEPITISAPPQMSPGYYPELEDRLSQAHEVAERAAKTLSSAGFIVTTSVTTGDPRERHFGRCSRMECRLDCPGSHGRTGLGRFLLGSVSEAVARHARCSVQIVRIPS